jgi:chemotaxis protein CheX
MPATQTITDALIQDSIVRAVQNVCRTMLKREAVLRASLAEPAPGTTFGIIGNVGFAGEANGIVYLCLTADFASFATGEILGMSPGEVEMHGWEVVKDAIGEITNMTVGGFKNALCDVGFPCKLSLPTIVRGDHLHVSAIKAAARHVFQFDCSGHTFYTDIQLKAE